MGLLLPVPATGTFQRMFFVSLHSIGGLAVGASPVPSGPRHVGQACAIAPAVDDRAGACGACASSVPGASATSHPAAAAPATTHPMLRRRDQRIRIPSRRDMMRPPMRITAACRLLFHVVLASAALPVLAQTPPLGQTPPAPAPPSAPPGTDAYTPGPD